MAKWPRVLLFVLPLMGCGPSKKTLECQANGIQYFKDIGSYPILPSAAGSDAGRFAEDVALERCQRSPFAFKRR